MTSLLEPITVSSHFREEGEKLFWFSCNCRWSLTNVKGKRRPQIWEYLKIPKTNFLNQLLVINELNMNTIELLQVSWMLFLPHEFSIFVCTISILVFWKKGFAVTRQIYQCTNLKWLLPFIKSDPTTPTQWSRVAECYENFTIFRTKDGVFFPFSNHIFKFCSFIHKYSRSLFIPANIFMSLVYWAGIRKQTEAYL